MEKDLLRHLMKRKKMKEIIPLSGNLKMTMKRNQK